MNTMHENLLRQIQSESVTSSADVPSLLRLCRLLAQRLNSEELKQWVMHELNGYPQSEELPDYRKDAQSIIYGDFMGWNAIMKRVQIPHSSIQSPLREKICHNEFRESIPRIVSLVSDGETNEAAVIIPADFYGFIIQDFLRDDFVVTRAWKWVSKQRIGNILSTVQNRILDFTLELESRASDSGDPLQQLKAMPKEVKQEFHTHIMGSVSNFSQGGDHVTQTTNITKGDLQAVALKLRELGFSDPEAHRFARTLAQEDPTTQGTFSERLREAIATASAKAGSGAIKISQSALGNILATISKQYLGIGD